jgi:Arc/MetJ-type ribon-helix-helix transcriptional regulator
MKVSVSLAEEDLEFLDEYARARQLPSRSAAVQRAITLLRATELGDAYADAWEDWTESGEAAAWEVTSADGASR